MFLLQLIIVVMYHISGKVMINGNIYLPRVLVNPNSKIVSTDCNCIYAMNIQPVVI